MPFEAERVRELVNRHLFHGLEDDGHLKGSVAIQLLTDELNILAAAEMMALMLEMSRAFSPISVSRRRSANFWCRLGFHDLEIAGVSPLGAVGTDILYRCRLCPRVSARRISGMWTLEQIRGTKS